jgi:hypothetical protein
MPTSRVGERALRRLVLLLRADARRGGGVGSIPCTSAAMAVLEEALSAGVAARLVYVPLPHGGPIYFALAARHF